MIINTTVEINGKYWATNIVLQTMENTGRIFRQQRFTLLRPYWIALFINFLSPLSLKKKKKGRFSTGRMYVTGRSHVRPYKV